MAEDYGFSIEEQLTLGFALSAITHAWDGGREAGVKCLVPPHVIEDLFVKLGWEDRKETALRFIAADRESLLKEFRESGETASHVVWETRPFMRHPFLRSCRSGALLLLSPRAIQSWLSDGMHYRLLDAAQRRAEGDPKRRLSRRYTAFAGELLERYVFELVSETYGERPVGGGRVYGEQPYQRDGASKTSDVAIDLGLDLVLIEVSVSRLRADTLLLGTPEEVQADLRRMIIRKVEQLDGTVSALLDGTAEIPAGKPEVDLARVERIWPVVVTAGNITQTEALWHYIREETRGRLQHGKVRPLTLLDPEDLEQLCGLIEHGHSLAGMLAGKTTPPFQDLELAVWLNEGPGAPRERPVPGVVARVWERSMDRAVAAIDFARGLPEAEAA